MILLELSFGAVTVSLPWPNEKTGNKFEKKLAIILEVDMTSRKK